jgi:hypothetical protein
MPSGARRNNNNNNTFMFLFVVCLCLCIVAALTCGIIALVWANNLDNQINPTSGVGTAPLSRQSSSRGGAEYEEVVSDQDDFFAESAATSAAGVQRSCATKECPLGADFGCHHDTCLSTIGRCSKSAHRCSVHADCCFCFHPEKPQSKKLCTVPAPPPPSPPTNSGGGACVNKVCPGGPEKACQRDLCVLQAGTQQGKCTLTGAPCIADAQCCQCRLVDAAGSVEHALCRPPVLVPHLCPDRVCSDRNFPCYTDHCVLVPGTSSGKCRFYSDQSCSTHADCECICRIKREDGGVPILEKCSLPPPPPPQCPVRKCALGPAIDGLCQPGKCVQNPGTALKVCAVPAGLTAIECATDADCCVCEHPLATRESVLCRV